MSIHLPGFQLFARIFASIVLAKVATSNIFLEDEFFNVLPKSSSLFYAILMDG